MRGFHLYVVLSLLLTYMIASCQQAPWPSHEDASGDGTKPPSSTEVPSPSSGDDGQVAFFVSIVVGITICSVLFVGVGFLCYCTLHERHKEMLLRRETTPRATLSVITLDSIPQALPNEDRHGLVPDIETYPIYEDWDFDATTCLSEGSTVSSPATSHLADSGYGSHEEHSIGSGRCNNIVSYHGLNPLEVERHALYLNTVVASFLFMDPIGVFTCDRSGGEYCNVLHDFTIRIPQDAIPEGLQVKVELGITCSGPFEFPHSLRPVSPIIWLHVTQPKMFQFHKPIEITLPHCLNLEKNHDVENLSLQFLTAGHKPMNVRGNYVFTVAEGRAKFHLGNTYGMLYTNQFCFGCIAAKLTQEDLARVTYCLVTVEPSFNTAPNWYVYYCICYCLKTCIQSLREQYAAQRNVVFKSIDFGFASDADPCLQIDFARQLPENWILTLKSGYQEIRAREVDFWSIIQEYSLDHLQCLEENQLYPPRYVIHVCGQGASCGAVAHVYFGGATKELKVEMHLPFVGHSTYSQETPRFGHVANPYHGYTFPRNNYHSIYAGMHPGGISSTGMQQGLAAPLPLVTNEHLLHGPSPSLQWVDPSPRPQYHGSLFPVPRGPGPWPPYYPAFGQRQPTLDSFLPPVDFPSNEELEEVTEEVMGKLGGNWQKLQAYLRIPDFIMSSIIEEEVTLRGRVSRMFREWRNCSQDHTTSREALADILKRADIRLKKAADLLTH